MAYFDYNATSPIRPEVRSAMAPFLEEAFGNASSLHGKGRQAREAVETVRARILSFLGDPSGELIFTSGGTEADNLALKGVVRAKDTAGSHLIVSAVEHQAVLHTAEALREEGADLTSIPVDRWGLVDLRALEASMTPRTVLISIMHANNEVGTVQPIDEIGRIARARGVLFHTDAVQSFGKIPLSAREAGVDLASLSAHKLGGPKGTGALYLRRGIKVKPLLHGGPHEHNLRGGTEAVAGIVGFGEAARISFEEQGDGRLTRVGRLRDLLEAGLRRQVPDLEVNGHLEKRLAGTSNLSFIGCPADTLLMALDLAGICVSIGSACSSGSQEPSHVLTAMGLPSSRRNGAIRFSLGWASTEEEVEKALETIPPIVERIRKSAIAQLGISP